MGGRAMDDDASIADLPWASVFDPAANVRALSAIQARGFRAATEVVDKFVQVAQRGFAAPTGPDDETGASDGGAHENGAVPEIGRIVQSLQNVVTQLGATAMRGATGSSSPVLDVDNATNTGEASLEADGPGAAVTEVWLHNRGAVDRGVLRLRCSDLLSHTGAVIDASRIRLDPQEVPMPARSSRGVTVEVDVTQDVPPGLYRGTLLADGHADVWMPVTLNLKSRSS